MAKVEVLDGDVFTQTTGSVWQYRNEHCRGISIDSVDPFVHGLKRSRGEGSLTTAEAVSLIVRWGHKVQMIDAPPSPEVTRRDEERRDSVALEAFKVIIATGYKDAAQAAADAYALADAMEAARKGGGGGC